METATGRTRAKHGEGLPKWDESKQQFSQHIGYSFNEDRKRVRRQWNFGKDFREACARSSEAWKAWAGVKNEVWPSVRPHFEVMLPDYDWSRPVWPEKWMLTECNLRLEDLQSQVQQKLAESQSLDRQIQEVSGRIAAKRLRSATEFDPDAIAKFLAERGLVATPVETPSPAAVPVEVVSIADAKDVYLAGQKGRIGRAGGKGLKVRTYNTKSKNLHLALGLPTAKTAKPRVLGRSPIDTTRMLTSITSCTPPAPTDAATRTFSPKKYHSTNAMAATPPTTTPISLASMLTSFLVVHVHAPAGGRKARRRRLFATTDTLEKLIAALARIGDSSHPVSGYSSPAATGTPTTL